jgi:hypothetical protein
MPPWPTPTGTDAEAEVLARLVNARNAIAGHLAYADAEGGIEAVRATLLMLYEGLGLRRPDVS